MDGSCETTVSKKSSLFVDAPNMRKIRDGVKRAKEKQAESVNKQHAKKQTKGIGKKCWKSAMFVHYDLRSKDKIHLQISASDDHKSM